VAFLCEALGVSRSGFYAWLMRRPSARSRRDEVLSAKIRSSFADSDRTYGARRVWHDLLAAGIECGLHSCHNHTSARTAYNYAEGRPRGPDETGAENARPSPRYAGTKQSTARSGARSTRHHRHAAAAPSANVAARRAKSDRRSGATHLSRQRSKNLS
jgi:putative transposase